MKTLSEAHKRHLSEYRTGKHHSEETKLKISLSRKAKSRNQELKPIIEKFMLRVSMEPNTGCWLWTGGIISWGYGVLYNTMKQKLSAHRLSYELFKGKIPKGLCVLHSCDTRSCVNPLHLHLGTVKDNFNEMIERRRKTPVIVKLTPSEVLEIRNSSLSHKKLSSLYGIAKITVWAIKNRRIWRAIP